MSSQQQGLQAVESHQGLHIGGANILLVEDDPDTRCGVEMRLAACNYDVASIGDGRRMLPLVQVRQPDLIILDLGLPGVDGLELLERLPLVVRRPPPVIVVSAWNEQRCEPLALARGASLYLEKPVEFGELLRAVEFVLRRP